MEHITWEFDGRCPRCGTEELEGNEDEGYTCKECEHQFIVDVNLNEAILY